APGGFIHVRQGFNFWPERLPLRLWIQQKTALFVGIGSQNNTATTKLRELLTHLCRDRQATLRVHIDGMTAKKVTHLCRIQGCYFHKKPLETTFSHFRTL